MHQPRQIRFLIPPFFLVLWPVWAKYVSSSSSIPPLADWTDLLRFAVALVAAALPLGYAMSVVVILIAKGYYRMRGSAFDAGAIDLSAIWPHLKMKHCAVPHRDRLEENRLYIVATFDHDVLPKGIHEFLLRRWTAFLIDLNSAAAIALSLAIDYAVRIKPPYDDWRFSVPTIVLIGCFLWAAQTARNETFGMIEFQARRHQPAKRPERSKPSTSEEEEEAGEEN
jgi:hypothetical protein